MTGQHKATAYRSRVTPSNHALSGRTIRFQLLSAVNVTIAVLVTAFLVFDYRRELGERLDQKRNALDEEAKTLAPGILLVRQQGTNAVQQYIDTVCAEMQDSISPGHHIAVRMGTETLQARAHHRASPALLKTLEAAVQTPSRRARFEDTELVVGVFARDDATVIVSEKLSDVKRSVRKGLVWRIAAHILMALAIAAVVNLVLWRVVTHPLKQLITTVDTIGRGNLGVQTGAFGSAEFNYLAAAVNLMSSSLAAADGERAIHMARARQIQQHLLPGHCDVPGLRIAHRFSPAGDVAGDYYDVLGLPDGSCLVCVADVVGHGVPAAMSATVLKAQLLTAPHDVLRFINKRFAVVSLAEDFATMVAVRLDLLTNNLEYASAGHGSAWLIDYGALEPRALASTGLVLGIDETAIWEQKRFAIAPGTRLLLVTDGVTETVNAQGELFGDQRLARLLTDCQSLSVEVAVQRMEEALAGFRDGKQTDDLCLMLVEVASDATIHQESRR